MTDFGFDNYRRLASIQDTLSGQGAPFSKFEFEWDPAGNLLKEKYAKVGGQVGDRYSYDAFDRVVGGKLGVKTQTDMSGTYPSAQSVMEIAYALDAGNSRDSVTLTPDSQTPVVVDYATEWNSPRYQSVGGASPVYDNEGNCVFDGIFYLAYDFKNRLSEVYLTFEEESSSSSMTVMQKLGGRRPLRGQVTRQALESSRQAIHQKLGHDLRKALTADPSIRKDGKLETSLQTSTSTTTSLILIAFYGYDPLNRRIARAVSGVLDHRYAYDGWREVEELVPTQVGENVHAVAQKAFIWGTRLDELLSYQRKDGTDWAPYYATQVGTIAWWPCIRVTARASSGWSTILMGGRTSSSAVARPRSGFRRSATRICSPGVASMRRRRSFTIGTGIYTQIGGGS